MGWPKLTELFRGKPDSAPPRVPPGPIPTRQIFPSWERFVRIAWVVALIVAAGLGGSVWWRVSRPEFQAVRFPEPKPVFNETGLHFAPAVSADGKRMIIASDRGRQDHLSLWLVGDGPVRRVTATVEEETDPDLSPDSREVAFRLMREGGAVYSAPIDGNRPPIKLADGGWRPRYSPDGRSIAYFRTDGHDSTLGYGRVYVMDRDGRNQRQVSPGFKMARYPVWIDEKHLLFEGRDAGGATDWWVADLASGQPPVRTGAFQILTDAFGKRSSLDRWSPGGVLFSASATSVLNIWQLPLDPATWQAGQLRRLTDGGAGEIHPTAVGNELFYVNPTRTTSVWQVAIDAERGIAKSPLQPVTESQAQTAVPMLSADGSRLAYLSNRTGAWELWTRTGSREERLSSFRDIGHRPVLSPDGRRIAVPMAEEGDCAIDIADLLKAGNDSVVEGCYNLWDWSPAGPMLVFNPLQRTRNVELLEGHGRSRPILSHPLHGVYAARFSPDGKWIAFLSGMTASDARVYVSPFTGKAIPSSQWVEMPGTAGGVPAWSPGGRLLYVCSNRDGHACLWAQPLDDRKRPLGEPFAVIHFHETAFGIAPLSYQELGLSMSADKLVLNLARDASTVWRTNFP